VRPARRRTSFHAIERRRDERAARLMAKGTMAPPPPERAPQPVTRPSTPPCMGLVEVDHVVHRPLLDDPVASRWTSCREVERAGRNELKG
jgi:hypothetical protein